MTIDHIKKIQNDIKEGYAIGRTNSLWLKVLEFTIELYKENEALKERFKNELNNDPLRW